MKQKSGPDKAPAEQVRKDIRRQTRRQYSRKRRSATSIWAMPVTSTAPIALRYSISIRVWAHMKLIRQIVLAVTWTELKGAGMGRLRPVA